MELKPITCVNCGAPIDLGTLKCEYCETNYKEVVQSSIVTYADEFIREGPLLTPNEVRALLVLKPIKMRGENI